MKLVTLLLIATFCANPCVAQNSEKLKHDVEQTLEREEFSQVSGIVLVAVGDDVLLSKGLGTADEKNKIRFSEDTIISIGSITKQFTGAAILNLEMQGKLKVEDKIGQYLPKLKAPLSERTIHEFLTHSSGIRLQSGDDRAAVSEADIIEQLNAADHAAPGKYHYSNLGYSLLGMVVEKLSDQSYGAFLRKEFFSKIGMEDTGYLIQDLESKPVALGYLEGKDWGYLHDKNWTSDGPYWNLRANGGILSTAHDMFLWQQSFKNSELLSEAAKAKYFAPHVREFDDHESYYGYGWVNEPLDSKSKATVIWHDGGNGIFSADARYYTHSKIYYFVAGNRSDGEIFPLSEALHNLISQY